MTRGAIAALALALTLSMAAPATAAEPSLYEQGVAARQAGDPAKAADLLGRVVALDPGNADGQVHLGYALIALGRLEEADRAFAAALAVAPDYADARAGRAIVAQRRGQGQGASLPQPAPQRSWSLDLDTSHAAVARGQPDWRQVDARLGFRSPAGWGAAARIESSRRFGRNDTYGQIEVDRSFAGGSSLYVLAGATPAADYRPRWQFGIGGRHSLTTGPSATVLTFDSRHARYPAGRVTSLTPGIEQYVAGGRVWLTGQGIGVIADGKLRAGALGRIDAMASDQLRLFAGAASAPDISEGVVIRSVSLFGGLSYAIDDRHSARASVARTRPSRGAVRAEAAVGLGLRF